MTFILLRPRPLLTLALIAVAPIVANAAPRSVSELLSRLAKGPLDPSVFFELEYQPPEPRIFAALAEAFEKRSSKEDQQWIALTMLHLGDRSERYLDLLSGYAKQAIEDRTPLWFVYGPSGDVVKGEMSHEFEKWCSENHRDPKEVGALQAMTYPEDVSFLARAQDARAADLLKRGLDSPNPLVVHYSAQGLALLQDNAALPSVVHSCERFPAGTASFVAGALAHYLTPEADLAMERLVKDANLRAEYKREAVRERAREANWKLAREKGKARE
jgi:hypothetical protein